MKRHNAIIFGALIADATAMGLHWIYSQPRIRRAAGEKPEFLEPNPETYKGVTSYFAHAGRHAGDQSMYGDGMILVLRTLSEKTPFDWQYYMQKFAAYYGFGGEYVGYVDSATRMVLLKQFEQQAAYKNLALSIPTDISDKKRQTTAAMVSDYAMRFRGEEFSRRVMEAVQENTLEKDSKESPEEREKIMGLVKEMIDAVKPKIDFPGSGDNQIPAVISVSVLSAAGYSFDVVEEAVRATHNNSAAVEWTLFFARLLQWTCAGGRHKDLEDGITTALSSASSEVREKVEKAVTLKKQDNKSATLKLGAACYLSAAIPSAVHNLLGAQDYVDAVRRNILAGGDSCGRAIVVGSLAALLYADSEEYILPQEWKEKLTRKEEILTLLSSLSQQ